MHYPSAFGNYVLLERLGSGGMSRVDLARRSVGEGSYVRFMAIKRITADNAGDNAFVRMFKDEARINAELHHRNIAQVYDFGEENGEFFLAMEYVPGLDLRHVQKRLQSKGLGMSVRVALTVLCQVLEGLQYAHSAVDTVGRPMKVIHRDVNPRNVMLSVSGEVKLIDFGVARAEDRLERTEGHTLKGKFTYMAPEQVEGKPIDHRVDLYSVGMMFHELMTGSNPLSGLDQIQVIHRILKGEVEGFEPPPEYPDPARLRAIHAKVLARDPDARYPDAEALRRDLEAAAWLVGGLCTRKDMAAFLKAVDPESVNGIRERLETYRLMPEEEISQSFSVNDPTLTRSLVPALGGTMAKAPAPGEPVSASIVAPPPAAQVGLSPTQLTLAIVGGVFLASLVLGAALIYLAWTMRPPVAFQPPQAPVEVAPVEPLEDGASPAPDGESAEGEVAEGALAEGEVAEGGVAEDGPAEVVASSGAGRADASAPARPDGGASTGGGAATDDAAEVSIWGELAPPPGPDGATGDAGQDGAGAPGGAGQAAPEVPADAADAGADAAGSAWGFLFVTSRPIGLEVVIDGRATGETTPLKLYKISTGAHQIQVRREDGSLSAPQRVSVAERQQVTAVFSSQ